MVKITGHGGGASWDKMENQEDLQTRIKKDGKNALLGVTTGVIATTIGAELLNQPWYMGAIFGPVAYILFDSAHSRYKEMRGKYRK